MADRPKAPGEHRKVMTMRPKRPKCPKLSFDRYGNPLLDGQLISPYQRGYSLKSSEGNRGRAELTVTIIVELPSIMVDGLTDGADESYEHTLDQ